MADDPVTSIQYIGRGLRAEAKTGQGGGLNPSAIQTNGLDFQGKPLPRSTVAASILAANKAKFISPDATGWQQRTVDASPIKANPGTKGPSKGAKVPHVTKRRDKAGNVRPTR
jgi:hypothetical protein